MDTSDDAHLWDALQSTDPVPPAVSMAARSAFAYRDMDGQLARLVEDSAMAGTVGVRGPVAVRSIAFEAEVLVVDIEVHERDGVVDCLGQLAPAQPGTVIIRHADGAQRQVETDELGRFRVDDVRLGPVSLRVLIRHGDEVQIIDTSWVTI